MIIIYTHVGKHRLLQQITAEKYWLVCDVYVIMYVYNYIDIDGQPLKKRMKIIEGEVDIVFVAF